MQQLLHCVLGWIILLWDWAISDWPGSLNNLFLIEEFIPDRRLRMRYLRSRLLPRRSQASLGAVEATDTINSFRLETARIRYLAYRGVVHLKDIASLPGRLIRWKACSGSLSEAHVWSRVLNGYSGMERQGMPITHAIALAISTPRSFAKRIRIG